MAQRLRRATRKLRCLVPGAAETISMIDKLDIGYTMKTLNSLTIGARLSAGFGALIVLMLLLAAFALLRIGAIADAVSAQEQVRQEKLEPLYVAREALRSEERRVG